MNNAVEFVDKPIKLVHVKFDRELHLQMRARALIENKSIGRFLEDAVRFYLTARYGELKDRATVSFCSESTDIDKVPLE